MLQNRIGMVLGELLMFKMYIESMRAVNELVIVGMYRP